MVSDIAYCTAVDIRTEMGATSTSDDVKLLTIAQAVSRLIDGHLGYVKDGFVASATATAREYSSGNNRHAWIDPCIEITSVKMKDATTDATYDVVFTVGSQVRGFRGDPNSQFIEYNTTPYHGIILLPTAPRQRFLDGRYSSIRGFRQHPDDGDATIYMPTVEVTAKWGYAETVPSVIRQASIMQSIRIYKRGEGGMADALLTGDFGQNRYMSKLDKDVQVLLDMSRLRRPQFVGR